MGQIRNPTMSAIWADSEYIYSLRVLLFLVESRCGAVAVESAALSRRTPFAALPVG